MKKLNMNDIAKEICVREGKKKQVSIAQVKEILGVLVDMMWDDPNVLTALLKNSQKRNL